MSRKQKKDVEEKVNLMTAFSRSAFPMKTENWKLWPMIHPETRSDETRWKLPEKRHCFGPFRKKAPSEPGTCA